LAEVADTAARVGPWLVQVGLGLAWVVLFLLAESEPRLGLALADALAVVGVPPGLALGLTLALGLVLALAEALALALAVLVLLWLPLDDVPGAVVVVVVRGGELVLVGAPGCVDDGAQGLREGCAARPALLDGTPPVAEDVGEIVPGPPLALALLEELLPTMAALRSPVTRNSPARAGGTTARTTPRANTAAPTPNAGRSIASRQSLGRFGSRSGSARLRWPPRCPAAPWAGWHGPDETGSWRGSAPGRPRPAPPDPRQREARGARSRRNPVLARRQSRGRISP
jgi:hypothetical protein